MDETEGLTAVNYGSLGSAADGTYSGVTLNSVDAPGGTRAPYFDGLNDSVEIYSAALEAALNLELSTALVWWRVYDAGVWTDSTYRLALVIGEDVSNRLVALRRTSVNNTVGYSYKAQGNEESVTTTDYADTTWHLAVVTIEKTADEVKFFIDGAQVGATQTGLLVYAGDLTTALTDIGCYNASSYWYGYLAHAAIYDKVLTADEIAAIYNAGTGTGGGRENYTTHAVDTVTLTQVHNLTVQDCSTEHVVDTPTLSEAAGSLTIQDAYTEQAVDTTALTQVHVLSVDDCYSETVIDTFAVTQAHVLTVADGYTTTYSDTTALTQLHVITIADAYTEQIADAVVLVGGGVTELEIDDAYTVTQADTLTLYWGLVALTLPTRATTLTLDTRDDDLSLRSRQTTLTLEDIR